MLVSSARSRGPTRDTRRAGRVRGRRGGRSALPPRRAVPDDAARSLAARARGRLRLAELGSAAALDDLLAAGELFVRRTPSPTTAPWRPDAALAQLAIGAQAEARVLADEQVALAEAFGAPRALGVALRAAGLAEDGRRGIDLLRQAVGVLEGSAARLEHARAMADLGAARRVGSRLESREILRPALDLARRCGALALTETGHPQRRDHGLHRDTCVIAMQRANSHVPPSGSLRSTRAISPSRGFESHPLRFSVAGGARPTRARLARRHPLTPRP
jgi:hypothetical protein